MDTRKLARRPRQIARDWHEADIVAALRKAGWSLRSLSRHHGYAPTSLSQAIHRPWPRAEALIAGAIGVPQETIWPSRAALRSQGQKARTQSKG